MTFHEFITLQCNEINRHKWIESEKVGYDLGLEAEMDWSLQYALRFRRYITDTMGEKIDIPSRP